jgi:hypothetical protein
MKIYILLENDEICAITERLRTAVAWLYNNPENKYMIMILNQYDESIMRGEF